MLLIMVVIWSSGLSTLLPFMSIGAGSHSEHDDGINRDACGSDYETCAESLQSDSKGK